MYTLQVVYYLFTQIIELQIFMMNLKDDFPHFLVQKISGVNQWTAVTVTDVSIYINHGEFYGETAAETSFSFQFFSRIVFFD